MEDMREDNKTLRLVKLRLGIYRFVVGGGGLRYLTSVRRCYPSYSQEDFDNSVSQLIERDMLTKTIGRNGAICLKQVVKESQ
jgi:hypothetical protein